MIPLFNIGLTEKSFDLYIRQIAEASDLIKSGPVHVVQTTSITLYTYLKMIKLLNKSA